MAPPKWITEKHAERMKQLHKLDIKFINGKCYYPKDGINIYEDKVIKYTDDQWRKLLKKIRRIYI